MDALRSLTCGLALAGVLAAQTPIILDAAVAYTTGGAYTESAALGDLDHDTHLDLVAANSFSATIAVLRGDGNAHFAPPALYATSGEHPLSIVLGDVDADGHLDVGYLMRLISGASVVALRPGDGTGAFGTERKVPSGVEPHALALGDLDADGRLDLVVARGASTVSAVRVLLQTAHGTFPTPLDIGVGSLPLDVELADLDHDADLDIVTANTVGRSISVLLGDGSGGFAPAVDSPAAGDAFAIALADFDGDTHVDVVCANGVYGETTISLLRGDGLGGFGAPTLVEVGGSPVGIAAADVNADGAPDVVTSQLASGSVAVLLGRGNGELAPPTHFVSTVTPLRVALGDLDHDGRPDVVSSNTTASAIAVLRANVVTWAAGYCTSGATTVAHCRPVLSISGIPSASAPSGFTVRGSALPSLAAGMLFYGIDGRSAVPWSGATGSTLCLRLPVQRTPVQSSSGATSCEGVIALDLHQFWASHGNALGQPLSAGQVVGVQLWMRDPGTPDTLMSAAVEFALAP